MLLRMYLRWGETGVQGRNRCLFRGEVAGIKSATVRTKALCLRLASHGDWRSSLSPQVPLRLRQPSAHLLCFYFVSPELDDDIDIELDMNGFA